jgi:hypothetical protein
MERNIEHLFTIGLTGLGVVSLVAGFLRNKIAIIVMRAFSGNVNLLSLPRGGQFTDRIYPVASLTVPSAMSLIVHIFPDPQAQSRALSIFFGVGAIGNVTGLVVGARDRLLTGRRAGAWEKRGFALVIFGKLEWYK